MPSKISLTFGSEGNQKRCSPMWKASNEAQHQKRGVYRTVNKTSSWNFADLTAQILATFRNQQLFFELAGQNKASLITQ